jgi:steroid 5-alpha reductase family enzyme
MFDWCIYLNGLYAMLAFASAGWVVSSIKNNVTLVDSMWSLFFLLATAMYISSGIGLTERNILLIIIVSIWSLRLAIYLGWRNWKPHEDHRYQAIRQNNEPHFWLKSLYIVFGFQALLAWVVSLPLLGIANSTAALQWLDHLGLLLFLSGLLWESIADWQLARFKAEPANQGAVLDTGVWRYSRHPNYFGEFCIWWGFYMMAVSAGAWWSIPGPLLMTLLLLKVSGVALLEKDIAERRPAYADYIKRTNAFFPGRPKER